ncbi:FtsW/RodA/SpoVE family cell cycle protein [Sutcliffiella halmapala]|uniref:FtsW/RodA/SpoVE family cell cycle protein n=1 Tax=Sutcliffiella halmapala TaxID=79882 RepID=UPI00099532D8|nr:FtsW/RodA/SpoVE family cell cycle protein [Sutcliffiella halmapala]
MEYNDKQQLDITLIFLMLMMVLASLFAIDSIEPTLPSNLQGINFMEKQLLWFLIGAFGIGASLLIHFDYLRNLAWITYGIGVIFLLGLEFNFPAPLVMNIKGATSWYYIPGIGNFQPSELMKISIILVLSKVIADHRAKFEDSSVRESFLLLFKIMGASLVPILLVAKQPDMGTTLVYLSIIAALIVVSGIRWRIIIGIVSICIAAAALFLYIFIQFPEFFHTYFIPEYQLNRFYGWLNPYEYQDAQGFQLVRSLLAIGSGEYTGAGYGSMNVYLPESHTDFIFSAIANQFGFLGATVVLSLFFLLLHKITIIALQCHDPYGSYLCTGIIGMITFQVFQNVGMTVGLLPITGIPLPFFSYGGSSLLTYMIAIGIVMNVQLRTRKYVFN